MAWSLTTFQRELKKIDPLLRIRRSLVDPAWYLIERRCKHGSPCLRKPLEKRGIDKWICDRDGYTDVCRVSYDMLNQQVFLHLRQMDMWQRPGKYADWLEEQEREEELRLNKQQSQQLQLAGEEAYDRGMVKQGDIVSSFHSKVGGWQP